MPFDTSEYEFFRGVPVFDEHDEYQCVGCGGPVQDVPYQCARCGQPARLVRRFDKPELDRIAAKNNERTRVQPSPLSLGHTIPGAPEFQQPVAVGYAGGYGVQFSDKHGRHVLTTDFAIRKDRVQEARTYPRVSVELWPKDGVIDPIALLRRTPQRDLGQWCYQADGGRLVYSREGDWMQYANGFNPPTPQVPPQSPYPMPPQPQMPTGQQPPQPVFQGDPTLPPDADAPDPAEMDRFMRCMKRYMAMGAGGGMSGPAPMEPAPYNMGGPAFPSSTNVSAPQLQPAAPAPQPPRPDSRFPMSYGKTDVERDSDAIRFAKLENQLAQLMQQLAAQQQQHATERAGDVERFQKERQAEHLEFQRMTLEVNREKSKQIVGQWLHEGYVVPNPAEMVERLTRMSPEERLSKDAEVRTCYQKAPVGGGFAPVQPTLTNYFGPPQTTIEQHRNALSLATQKNIGYDDALKQIKGTE